MYNAIVGFHDKELSDLTFESLQDQEYSLGYKIHVMELPPFDEDEFENQQQQYWSMNEEDIIILSYIGMYANWKGGGCVECVLDKYVRRQFFLYSYQSKGWKTGWGKLPFWKEFLFFVT